jgi:uncharacterized protein (DUF488 family)
MARKLFTVGYQGTTIEAFIAHLTNKNIDCVLDVRAFPLSRKPGFSKTALAQTLSRAKIQYAHLGDLGTPKPIRDNLKSDGDYPRFFKRMNAYLAGQKDAIEAAYSYVLNNTCCLMCFERLAAECHRKIVAAKIKARNGNGLKVKHI